MTTEVIGYPELEGFSSLLGYVGMICILTAFAMETRGMISSRGTRYLILMAFGSGLLGLRALHTWELAFLLLEAVWMTVALWALTHPPDEADSATESA